MTKETKEEKALNYSVEVSMYNRPTNGEYDTATYKAFLAGYNWRDQQLKEYLKKAYKREKNSNNKTSGDAAYFFSIRMKLIEKIINELFKEE